MALQRRGNLPGLCQEGDLPLERCAIGDDKHNGIFIWNLVDGAQNDSNLVGKPLFNESHLISFNYAVL